MGVNYTQFICPKIRACSTNICGQAYFFSGDTSENSFVYVNSPRIKIS